MTQIANLPQIDGTRTSFTFALGSVFQYAIAFPSPIGPQVPIVAAATMASGSATLSNLPAATVSSLVTGQPVAGYGIPAGATIAGLPSATSVTLSQAATQTGAAIGVTFQVIPLDLTGITFRQQVRRSASPIDTGVLLEMSTANGRLLNGGTSGVLSAVVNPQTDQTAFSSLPVTAAGQTWVTDIVATAADGGPINLMAQSGPASVVVLSTVTR